jgi:predicted amidohydrolase
VPRTTSHYAAKRRQQQPIAACQLRASLLPPQNRQLVAQNEQLEFLRAFAACEQHDEREQPTDKQIDEQHRQPPRKGAPDATRLPATDLSQPTAPHDGVCAPHGDLALTAVRASLLIAVAQPSCATKDVRANVLEHARVIRAAKARLVVFPELSLTGYELDAAAVSPDDEELGAIVTACTETGSVALVGAPVESRDGRVHIGMLLVSSTGAEIAYRKSYLGGDGPVRFAPGDGPVAIDLEGWRVGLGICKDTGVEQHISDTAALDLDLYVAGLVHRPEELEMQEERGLRIARACQAYVAFASFAGSTGGGFDQTAGMSSIWAPDGTPLARADVEPGEFARASLT